MFKLFKKKEDEKKYKNIYELAKQNCDEFKKNNDYTEFTQQTIAKIEQDIAELSEQGVRELIYHTKEFHIHTDMEQVRNYFKEQGFKVYKFTYFDNQYGIFAPYKCLSAGIRW